jgi:thiaminase/transcriptional activator TenA
MHSDRAFSAHAREAADELWQAQLHHPFIRGVADGTIDPDRFRFFIRQDYLYLIDYGRCFALAAARAPGLDLMARFSELSDMTLRTEMALHLSFAADWGVTREQLEAEPIGPTTRAYANFLLRTAALGELGELIAALLPCMWGYSWLGRCLAESPPPANELCARWIESYASDEFAELAGWCREICDSIAADAGPAQRERMLEAFLVCSRYELEFWEAAWPSVP